MRARNDQQIAALEMLAQCVALSTWAHALAGRRVVFFSDNSVAECTFRKGAAKSRDHNHLVHQFWSAVVALKAAPQSRAARHVRAAAPPRQVHAWIERVESARNLADLPSREERELLSRLGGKRVRAQLAEAFRCGPPPASAAR